MSRSHGAIGIFGVAAFLAATLFFVSASTMTPISDTISTSAPMASTTHTIAFTTTGAVPASGRIVITPQSSAYTLPSGFDHTDVDLSVGGTDRDLAASATATEDGVAVNTGTGVVTITLNSTSGIGAGASVVVELGYRASHQGDGDLAPVNSTVGSYRIVVETQNAGGSQIDIGKAMIFVIAQVGVETVLHNQPPTRSNGLPSGLIAANNPAIEVTVNTDEPATCRYATTTGVAYPSMTGSFTAVTSFLYHFVFTPHQNDTEYNYYVRCSDSTNTYNTDDYVINFTLDETPISDTSIPSTGVFGKGGSGVRGGSEVLFLSSIAVSGYFAPASSVTIMRDGVLAARVPTLDNGRFSYTIQNIERGSYTILVTGEDAAGRRSSGYASTITVGQGTQNYISNIMISPTIDLEEESVGLGEPARAFGSAIPGSLVEVFVQAQTGQGEAQKYSATSTTGTWTVDIDTEGLDRGTYVVRARAKLLSGAASNVSIPAYLGVGERPSACGTPDINGDEKVNLVDFSIFLTDWGTDSGRSDFNCDQRVNLADFSIMLFNWTS